MAQCNIPGKTELASYHMHCCHLRVFVLFYWWFWMILEVLTGGWLHFWLFKDIWAWYFQLEGTKAAYVSGKDERKVWMYKVNQMVKFGLADFKYIENLPGQPKSWNVSEFTKSLSYPSLNYREPTVLIGHVNFYYSQTISHHCHYTVASICAGHLS